MEGEQSVTNAPFRIRLRSRNACDSCRKRKRKCDGTHPCVECLGYGYECSYLRMRAKPSHRSNGGNSKETNKPVISQSPTSNISDSDIAMRWNDPHAELSAAKSNMSSVPETELSILEPYKSRFMGAHSAVAFARKVGMELSMDNPPRLHSYAWHVGLRPEHANPISPMVCRLLSLQDAMAFSSTYFDIVNPLYGILDRELFIHRCKTYWSTRGMGVDFEAVICGVVALGSIFSTSVPFAEEWDLVEHARHLLEVSISEPPANITLDHVVAWILRVLYLRLTSRPHICWMAISITMHLCEAVGLHQEIDTIQFAEEGDRRRFAPSELDTRRRLFWVSWSLNTILASEYGRSRVQVDSIRCRKPAPREEDYTSDLIALAEVISHAHEPGNMCSFELGKAIGQLIHLRDSTPTFILLKADVCLILCRLMRLINHNFSTEQVHDIIQILQRAWTEARTLALQQRPWWSIVSVPFHSVLLLLCINTREAISTIAEAMNTLVDVSFVYDTHLTKEAVETARLLICQSQQRKQEDLGFLEGLGSSAMVPNMNTSGNSLVLSNNPFEGLTDGNLGVTQFFSSDAL